MNNIILKIEEEFGIKIEKIFSSSNYARDITKTDIAIINSHNFDLVFYEKQAMVMICKHCSAEAELIRMLDGELRFDGFYEGKSMNLKYLTCEQMLMTNACE